MTFFELTHIGAFHVNHNEDFLILEDSGQQTKLIAVMDGCSSGTDSHFASALIGKILRKLAKQEAYRAFAEKNISEPGVQLERIALLLFEELVSMSRLLDLKSDELLSTVIMGIIDIKNKNGAFLIAGDGLIHINGQNIEYDSNNKPDYIGYHLNMDKHLWLQTKTHRKSIESVHDLSISTDGIHTFRNFDGKTYPKISQEDIFHAFFTDQEDLNNPNKLKRTLWEIKEKYGLAPSDDLTIIRVVS
jgi:hypothetical protein